MPGPPPNPNARRRNARPDWIELPSEGRTGAPPKWPLPFIDQPAVSKHVAEVWASVWLTPQASMWERLRWTRTVARYVLVVVGAEASLARDMLSEARQLEDHLGLTPMSLKRLQWVIVEDEVGKKRTTTSGKAAKSSRLTAV